MNAALERFVWQRADSICEYCRMPHELDAAPFQIDHIIAQKQGGATEPGNLALACLSCNLFKGPNVAGVDPDTQNITRLFHPRTDDWEEHFCWQAAKIVGLSAIGRSTAYVLAINGPSRVAIRASLLAEGRFP